mgnify:CR=1 FL=1
MSLEWQAAWQALVHHPLFGVGITLGVYQLAIAGYERTRWVFLQPVLVSMLAVIGILLACGLTFAEYRDAALRCAAGFSALGIGEGDVVAANLPIALRQEKYFQYSLPYYQTYQVLVQRKSDSIISEPAYLAGKTVYIRKNSAYEKRLFALQDEIGAAIDIRYQNTSPLTEDLIEEVVNGRISYTLAHENQARVAKDMHPNLDIATRMSFEQRIAFGLRPKSKVLKQKLDAFLQVYLASEAYTLLKKRYFDYIVSTPTEFFLTPKGALSPFDAFFKKAAQKYNWDFVTEQYLEVFKELKKK